MASDPHDRYVGSRRFFAETGHAVSGPFLAFLDHYGLTVCGFPVSDLVDEDGVPTQYFQHLALQETPSGGLRLKRLGESWLALSRDLRPDEGTAHSRGLREVDLVGSLPRHPRRTYPSRVLADIRYLVLHHTGASSEVGIRAVAEEHVLANDWPGIGYHYVVDTSGVVYRTQDLTTVSHHVRQFNHVGVGIALMGNFAETLPTVAQVRGAADLVAHLLGSLGLPTGAVRGHREMVATACPGETFLSVWKPRLMLHVERRLCGGPAESGDQASALIESSSDLAEQPSAPTDEVTALTEHAPDPPGRE